MDRAQIPTELKAEILSEALPYIRRFHGRTIVVKYGGNAMTQQPLKESFAHDIVLLKLVGMKSRFVQGMRVTDAETMEIVEWVLAGQVQQELVMLINRFGGQAVGLTGKDGGLIQARRMRLPDRDDPSLTHDLGQVGEIEAIDPSPVRALQDGAFIPVISPIGFGADGLSYNINADLVAGKIAEILCAEKLVLLTNTPGVLDRDGRLITGLTASRIEELFTDGTISGGMLPKISSALEAAHGGVNSVHIIDGRVDHCLLLEILTDRGVGTMIRSH